MVAQVIIRIRNTNLFKQMFQVEMVDLPMLGLLQEQEQTLQDFRLIHMMLL